jgi:hypothetical protein
MITWVMALSPLRRWIFGIGAGLFILFIGLRWYGNRQYDMGRQQGEATLARQLEQRITEARNEERQRLQIERQQIEAARAELDQARQAFARERANGLATFTRNLTQIETTLAEGRGRANQLPAGELPTAIRAANGEYSTRRSTVNR